MKRDYQKPKMRVFPMKQVQLLQASLFGVQVSRGAYTRGCSAGGDAPDDDEVWDN